MVEEARKILPGWLTPQFAVAIAVMLFGFGASWNEQNADTESIRAEMKLIRAQTTAEVAAVRSETMGRIDLISARSTASETSLARELERVHTALERLNERLDQMAREGRRGQ